MDIAEFIAARLDEDEQAARAAWQCQSHNSDDPRSGGASWQAVGSLLLSEQPKGVYDDVAEVINYGLDDVLVHAARHDPARVLADVAAKRAILAEHWNLNAELEAEHWACARCQDRSRHDAMRWPCPTLRALASIWADHPDYLPEWSA